MCIQLLRFAIFRSCCQQAHGNTFAIASQEPTMLWSFLISVSNSVKRPSRVTFLMHVFAGLCTGKVTLSYWMLQNPGQNVQEIDAAKCIEVILKNAQCPIDQRTKAISAVQSSWQTTRVTLIHTIPTKIQSSFFQFM